MSTRISCILTQSARKFSDQNFPALFGPQGTAQQGEWVREMIELEQEL